MIDWVVVLTPLLALGAVLLLGFAGCDVVLGLQKIRNVEIVARVPSTLTATQILFGCLDPSGSGTQMIENNPTAYSTDEGDSLYEQSCGTPTKGTWTFRCRVNVTEGAASAQAVADGMFPFDGSGDVIVATFQASGSPTGGDFAVAYVGASV